MYSTVYQKQPMSSAAKQLQYCNTSIHQLRTEYTSDFIEKKTYQRTRQHRFGTFDGVSAWPARAFVNLPAPSQANTVPFSLSAIVAHVSWRIANQIHKIEKLSRWITTEYLCRLIDEFSTQYSRFAAFQTPVRALPRFKAPLAPRIVNAHRTYSITLCVRSGFLLYSGWSHFDARTVLRNVLLDTRVHPPPHSGGLGHPLPAAYSILLRTYLDLC